MGLNGYESVSRFSFITMHGIEKKRNMAVLLLMCLDKTLDARSPQSVIGSSVIESTACLAESVREWIDMHGFRSTRRLVK